MLAFIANIGRALPSLIGIRLPDRLARVVGVTILSCVLIAVAVIAKCAYDASVINRYKVEQQASQARASLEAERRANTEAAADKARVQELTRELETAATEAARADPPAAAATVGPVTRSYYETLRKQK